jgi:hypothetical protein
MTCDEVKPLLNARMDGEIDMAQNATLDSHLAECQSCARDLEQLYNIRTAIREGMPYYAAPPALRDQVRFALRGAEYLDRTAPRRPWRMWGSAAAVFVLRLLASPTVFGRQNSAFWSPRSFCRHQRALIGRELTLSRLTNIPSNPVQRETPILSAGNPLTGGFRLRPFGLHWRKPGSRARLSPA